jgi:LmbE family N-acetylglucosaminyl deacetylase
MDVEVFANAENLRRVVDSMRRFDPDVVITHSPVDYMLDHEETSRLVRGATFAMAMPNYETRQNPPAKVCRATPALYYADALEGTDPLGQRIYPHFYVDISKQLSSKREMLARHSSQREWLRSHHGLDEYLDRMIAWAEGLGRECGFAYAEAFRQHLGHGYPHEPLLQKALAQLVHGRKPDETGQASG